MEMIVDVFSEAWYQVEGVYSTIKEARRIRFSISIFRVVSKLIMWGSAKAVYKRFICKTRSLIFKYIKKMAINAEEEPYNLQELLRTDIRTPISPVIVSKITSVAPWISVPGVFSIRNISNPVTVTTSTDPDIDISPILQYAKASPTAPVL